jgi:hypothetical protein
VPYTFCIKIEERLIQTTTQSGWYKEAPRADRRLPNKGIDNQFEEENMTHTRHNGGELRSSSAKT